MSTARGALTIGSVAATPACEALSAAEEGGKRWMLHYRYGRLLDGSCVAVAAAVDRCCYADVDVVSVVWGCFRVAPVSLPATYVTHAPMVYTFTVAPARGPGDERKRSGALGRTAAGNGSTPSRNGNGNGNASTPSGQREREEKATTDTQQLSRGTRHPTLAATASERCARPESSSLKSQARAN